MEEGWFLMSRKDDFLYFEEKFTRWQAWQDMIRLASYKETYSHIRGITIKHEKGKIYESMETLSTRWKWSRGKVNRFLEELRELGRIEIERNRVVTCVTISNYNKYQFDVECEKKQIVQQNFNLNNYESTQYKTENKKTVQQIEQQTVQQTVQQNVQQIVQQNFNLNNYESTQYKTENKKTVQQIEQQTVQQIEQQINKVKEREKEKKESNKENKEKDKENSVDVVEACACEEFVANEKISETMRSFGRLFNEQSIMNLRNCGHDIRGEDELFALFDEFQTHTIASGIEIRNEKELKRHFANWARIRLKSKPKEAGEAQKRERFYQFIDAIYDYENGNNK